MEFITKSPQQTRKLVRQFAEKIIKRKPGVKALVIGLLGDLGGGKTTFLQGFAKGLGVKEKIVSPTFVIIKRFQFNNLTTKQFNNFFHVDCYRVQKPKELLGLGLKKIISNPKNIIAIEWANRIKKILPPKILILNFSFIDKNKRKIFIINRRIYKSQNFAKQNFGGTQVP